MADTNMRRKNKSSDLLLSFVQYRTFIVRLVEASFSVNPSTHLLSTHVVPIEWKIMMRQNLCHSVAATLPYNPRKVPNANIRSVAYSAL